MQTEPLQSHGAVGWQESNPAQTLCGRDLVSHLLTAGQAQVDPEVSGEEVSVAK